jgi:hypothetical protein
VANVAIMADSGERQRPWWWRLLTHPLLLLIAGAAATYVVGPYITQKWHDQQAKLDSNRAQLELKTRLLRQIATLTIKEIGFIDDGFSSQLGLSTNTSTRLRASTRRQWIQESADIEGELSAWFPEKNSTASTKTTPLALRWVHLENRTLDFEAQQARLEPIFAARPKMGHVRSEGELARLYDANDTLIAKQLTILHHMRSAREQDSAADPNGPLKGLWKAIDNARLDARPETAVPGSIGTHDVRVEAAIHSAAIAELNDARERLARRLLASRAIGYR